MAGKLITTSASFYRRGIPNSYTGFGLLTLNNYTIANVRQNSFYFQSPTTKSIATKNKKGF
jgi:hypothetical protein